MAPRTIVKAALAAMVLSSADAVRHRRAKSEGMAASKMMGDVPIYSYEYRGEAQKSKGQFSTAAVASYQWIVMLDAKSVDSFCGSEIECEQIGAKNGVPFVRVSATESALEEVLKRHKGEVEFVEPDLPVEVIPEILEPQALSTVQSTPWSHDKVELSEATATGEGVHIYVMDTGVRTTHVDFTGRAIPTLDVFKRQITCAPDDNKCAADSHGHGTHCAGTAGGDTYGVATGATIHAMKVCCGYGSDLYGGMSWLVINAIKPAIMTMSLGSSGTPASGRVAVDAVVDSGVTVFVSAGNSDIDSCTKSYTFVRSAIGVGSIDPSNTRSYFSNWGTCNAIYAPGRSIPSASKDSDTGSSVKSGTSMAAPLVAGSAALLLQANPSWNSVDIRTKLITSAKYGVLSDLKTGDPNLLLDVSTFDLSTV